MPTSAPIATSTPKLVTSNVPIRKSVGYTLFSSPMMSQRRHRAYAALLVAALAGCSRPETQPPAETGSTPPTARWSIQVEPLATPAAGQTAYPQLTSSTRGVILSWLENAEQTSTL